MSTSQNFPHGLDFMRSVIRLMMQDERFCPRCVEYLDESYFTGELKWFFRKISEFYRNWNHAPNDSTIASDINLQGLDAQRYVDEFQRIQNADVDADYIKRELTGFVRRNIFVGSMKEAATLYNTGSTQDAYTFTLAKMQELQKVDFEKEKVSSFGDHVLVIQQSTHEVVNAIPTGIASIDRALNGGLMPQTWTTWLAGSNAGKSMLMPNLARFAAYRGKKTFVTIHEDEEVPTKLRYLACFSGIPIQRLMTAIVNPLTPEEAEQVRIADVFLHQHVKLRFMYSEESTIESVKQAARMLHKEWPYDLLLCDYGQCLTSKRFPSLDNTRLIQEYIYHELKQLCLELNIAGSGSAQVNRVGHALSKSGADLLRMTDVGESWGIAKKASNVITINRSDADVRSNRIIFLLDKNRNGPCPVVVECVSDYTSARVYKDGPGEQRDLNMNLTPVSPDVPPPEYVQALVREAQGGHLAPAPVAASV